MKLLLITLALGVALVAASNSTGSCNCIDGVCSGSGCKREVTEDVVVEKREAGGPCSGCYVQGRFVARDPCPPACLVNGGIGKREAEEGCSRVCSFGNTGCKMICKKREASEEGCSRVCSFGNTGCKMICKKREAVDRFIEKRGDEGKCHLRCHDQGCDLLPKGCQENKRDVAQLRKRSAELAAAAEGKCHLRCHDQGCDLLPKGCQEKKRDVVEKREAAEDRVCSRVCKYGNTGCQLLCSTGGKREATEEVVKKREAAEGKCHLRCHDQGCDLLPKGCKQDKRDVEQLMKRAAEVSAELGAGCRLDCSHLDHCFRVCV